MKTNKQNLAPELQNRIAPTSGQEQILTLQQWRRAACKRMRVVHPFSGTAGNLVSVGCGFATIFIGYERHGGIQCPRYIRFPLHEIQPEAPLKQGDKI
jgi:hypothetical protein